MAMSPKVILLASICLNAGLGIAYVMSPKAVVPSPSVISENAPGRTPAKKTSSGGSLKQEVITTVVDPGFHWSEVEAADYKDYIAKLRGIKCPEATIRDIIVADIDKLFEPRIAALREPPTYQPDKFWISDMYYGSSSRKRDPVKAEQMKAVMEERAALLKDLLGVEEKELRQAYSSWEDNSKKAFDYLPEEIRAKLKDLDKKFNDERNKLYSDAGGYIDMETQDAVKKARKKMQEEMKAFMTPEQIFEYDVRSSETAQSMKYELRGLDVSEEEFRLLYNARKTQEESRFSSSGERPTPEQMKAAQESRKQAQEAVMAAMGADRYKEIEMNQDYYYRQMVSAAPFLGFDKAAVMRVNDLKSESEKAANDIRRNQSLSPEERSKALQDIRTAAEAAVAKEIGEKGYKYYKRQGGYWMNNISPRVITHASP
ncbi:MAG TPA: hypothetical protein VGH19_13660 [Verrucomicrobiae bacterium]